LQREQEFEQLEVKIRNIRMDEYEDELKKLYGFLSSALKNNFLFTPISWEAFYANYLKAASFINPEYVLLAENLKGDIIGFIFSYDDLINTSKKNLVFKTIVRDAAKKWAGLGHVMSNQVIRKVKNKGYDCFIHAFMLEQGSSTGLSKSFKGNIYKNYSLYGLKI
ncbi:MAG: hypothetical protein M3512_03600, partial [Bacteroidota bacterium]|nr:hypothetical protein [Bacteroidota bacterium]